jgi:hypothetical protein
MCNMMRAGCGRRALRTDSMRIFVLDEADEMLSRGCEARRRSLAPLAYDFRGPLSPPERAAVLPC